MAQCLAKAVWPMPATFGMEHAKLAIGEARRLYKTDAITDEMFDRVISRLGNHSQLRQQLTMNGFITREPDALANALEKILAPLRDGQASKLEEMASGKPPASKK